MKIADNTLPALDRYMVEQLNFLYPPQEIKSMLKMALEHFFDYDLRYLALNPKIRFNESQLLDIVYLVKDLKKGIPIQHIFGYGYFRGLKIKVNEHVLIPRPETEELCDWILTEIKNKESLDVLDIGAGSGCISLALKNEHPTLNVRAIDVSEKAIQQAKENANDLNLDIEFVRFDVLKDDISSIKKVDLIVSNPPYVLKSQAEKLHQNVVNNEPHLALFVEDDDPLIFFKRIMEIAKQKLNNGGRLYFEINENFGTELAELMHTQGFNQVEIKKDLQGKDRMIRGNK